MLVNYGVLLTRVECLLSLTFSGIKVQPETIQVVGDLLKWFAAAENWGAIILLDKANIYLK
jgi:hypothetical protein